MKTYKSLRVMPEYGTSGIWVNESVGPFRHGMIKHEALGLDPELSKRFAAWIEKYWQILDVPREFDVASFNDEGRELAKDLKRQYGDATEILYTPLNIDYRLAKDEIITIGGLDTPP